MDIAALILSVLAVLMSGASIVMLLAQKFSTHQIQMVPADSLRGTSDKGLDLEDFEIDTDPEFVDKH